MPLPRKDFGGADARSAAETDREWCAASSCERASNISTATRIEKIMDAYMASSAPSLDGRSWPSIPTVAQEKDLREVSIACGDLEPASETHCDASLQQASTKKRGTRTPSLCGSCGNEKHTGNAQPNDVTTVLYEIVETDENHATSGGANKKSEKAPTYRFEKHFELRNLYETLHHDDVMAYGTTTRTMLLSYLPHSIALSSKCVKCPHPTCLLLGRRRKCARVREADGLMSSCVMQLPAFHVYCVFVWYSGGCAMLPPLSAGIRYDGLWPCVLRARPILVRHSDRLDVLGSRNRHGGLDAPHLSHLRSQSGHERTESRVCAENLPFPHPFSSCSFYCHTSELRGTSLSTTIPRIPRSFDPASQYRSLARFRAPPPSSSSSSSSSLTRCTAVSRQC